ncbi:Glycosylated lysosomal membrane protein A [Eumeta japonica]|uniref:Glycosylated lysosomal membrane protein A n=1 Tax=Eumeta variegata TaxID=151549 RepID=A0A4C1U6A4_EUMVA|nr:Glycosylated lysosomal membrane protein A [Eumeta japonica]
MDDRSPRREYDLRYLSWSRVRGLLNSSQEAMIQMEAYRFKFNNNWHSGTISVKLDLIPRRDYAQDLPHLIHTANSTLVDISLANVTTWKGYNSSRLALGMCLLSTDGIDDTMRLSVRKSLDDEHTPGVFEIIEIKTPESYNHGDGGFLQFRPVGYTTKERGVTSSTNVHISSFNRTSRIPKGSTLDRFYKYYDVDNLLVQSLAISFGESNDGFYNAINFTSWSFMIGYGVPPAEGVSFFVIMIITIGLGIPIILGLSGILYVVVRRCRQKNPRQRLTE